MPHTTWNEILFALNGYYDDVSKGDCYEQGILVDQDLEVAVSFYRKAAEQGNAEGLFRLGRYHFKLAHIADAAKYYALAAARIHEAARSALLALTAAADTNGVADYHLALLFTHEQNWALARNHYQRAIAHHYPDAAYQLGLLYMENRLTPTGGAIIIGQNISEALRYYKIAASEYSFAGLNAIMELIGTSSKASFYLGELYASIEGIPSKNMARAIEYYTLSSEKGDPDAPFRLGEIFELGAEGVAINLQRACGHYLCAAKRRNISALNKLREIARAKVIEAQLSLHDYFLSQGNKLEAIQWAMRASEQKHSGMQRYLDETTFSHTEALQIAQWYESSDVVTPSLERAFGFYQKADTLGNRDASFCLAKTYENGSALINQDYHLSANYYLKAANRGHPDALSCLLRIVGNAITPELLFGIGEYYRQSLSDHLNAAVWYQQAADLGNPTALAALNEVSARFPDCAYAIAQRYQQKADEAAVFAESAPGEGALSGSVFSDREVLLRKTLEYYALSLKQHHGETIKALELLGLSGIVQAQSMLYHYYHTNNKFSESAAWAMRGSFSGNLAATEYLNTTVFEEEILLQVAHWYEKDKIIPANLALALKFYQRANDQESQAAAYRLGQIFEAGVEIGEQHIDTDEIQAAHHYLNAAHRGHLQALTHALRLVTLHPTAELCHQVAKHYHQDQGDSLAAIPWYKRSADQSHEASQTALLSLAGSNATYAYTIGKTYQEKSSWKTACQYYHAALSAHHADSIHALKTMGLQPFLTAQMMLHAYYLSQGDRLEAVRWAIRAAAEGHEPAKHFLTTTLFTGEEFDQIGKMYEAGEIVRRQMAIAISYYQKASGAGLARSSFRLAQLFEAGETDCARDLVKSADYYLFAARQQHPSAYPEALSALIPLVEQLNDAKRYHTLGDYYQVTLNDASRAARWYQQALFRGHDISAESLKTLAKANATVAVEIAGRYEARALERAGSAEEGSSQEHAIHFYHFGLERDYQAALSALERIGIQGSVAAQYLVHRYYETKHNTSQAIHWALRAADKAHIQTLRYLDESAFSASDCANIAAYYERGEWITANLDRAIVFYTRAAALNHRDSMIRLGDYYCEETATRAPNIDQACKYYLRAIRQGHRPSLMAIEAIGERASAAIQYEIAELYFRAPFNTLSKAKKWYVHAAEAGHGAAATQLSRLENQAATLSGATLFRRVTLTTGHTEANLLSDGRGNFKAGLDGRQIDDTDSLSHCLHQLER